jgi:hypothetical protein
VALGDQRRCQFLFLFFFFCLFHAVFFVCRWFLIVLVSSIPSLIVSFVIASE